MDYDGHLRHLPDMEDEETATGMTLSPITATCSLSWNNYAPSPASTTGGSSPASMPPPANVVALQVIATAPPAPPSDNIINHHREDEAAHLTCSTIDTAIMGRMTAGSGRHRRHHGSRHLTCSPRANAKRGQDAAPRDPQSTQTTSTGSCPTVKNGSPQRARNRATWGRLRKFCVDFCRHLHRLPKYRIIFAIPKESCTSLST